MNAATDWGRDLRRVARLLASKREPAEVFDAVARAVSSGLGARAARVWLAEPSEKTLRIQWSWGLETAHDTQLMDVPAIAYGQGIVGEAFSAGEARYIADVQTDARWLDHRFAAVAGIHAASIMPLIADDRPLGVLSVFFADHRAFGDEERELLAVLADHAALAIRNARLLEGERRASREAAAGEARYRELHRAIDEIATAVAGEDDFHRVFAFFAERTCMLLAADGASLARIEGDEIVFEHQWGFESASPVPSRRKLHEGLAGRSIAAGQRVACADVAADARWRESPLLAHGFQAILAVPILHGATVAGMLAVLQRAPRTFSDDEAELLAMLTRHLAVALDRAGRRREQDILLAASHAIGSTLDLIEVMRRVARGLAHALGADMVGAYLADAEATALHPVAGYRVPNAALEAFRAHPIPLRGHAAIEEAWERRAVSWTSDASAHPGVDPATYARFPHQSVLFAPIVAGGRPAGGFFAVWWQQKHVFTAQEVRLAEAIGGQAGIAVGNARLYEEAERQRREAETLTRLVRDINSSLDRDVLLERVCQSARGLCDSDLAGLALSEDGSDLLVARHEVGGRGALRKLRFAPGRGAAGGVLLTRRPFRTTNYAADARITREYAGAAEREGLVSVLVVPVQRDGAIEALLYVGNRSSRPFTDQDEAALLRLADHVGVALANSRLFAREADARQDAQSSEQRVRDLMDSLDAVVWEWDVEAGRYSFVSQRAETMLGVPLARWQTERDFWMSRIHPDDHARVAAARASAIAEGADGDSEYRIVHASGAVRWVRERVTVTRDEDGHTGRLRAVVVDTTVRRHAQEQLRKLSRAVDQSPVSIIVTDVTGAIEYVNPRFTALTGYAADEALGKNPRILKSGATPREEYEHLWATITAGRQWSGVFENRKKDGRTFWASASISPVKDADGTITHFIGIQEDITARKAAEQALRESEARFRTVTESAPDAIISADSAGIVVSWNDAARAVFGYTADEIVGRSLTALMPLAYRDRHQQALAMVAEHGTLTSAGTIRTLEGLRKDGTQFPIELTVSSWTAGGRAHYTGIVRDVTERMRTQAALQHKEEQLRQTQKMEAIGRLAGGVAHDFNNVLTVIKGRGLMLLQSLDARDARRANAELILGGADRAARLTRQLLAFSRRQVLQPKDIDLNHVVQAIAPMLRSLIREDIDVVISCGQEPRLVKVDPGQIDQVILNLAVNARDAMADGGRLTIETGVAVLDEAGARRFGDLAPGEYVTVAVADTGVGMSDEVRVRAFEPFFTTKPRGEGTGLGLATVYGIVTQSGGGITVDSVPGRGSTFTVYLPRMAPSAPAAPGTASGSAAKGTETIVVAEDETDVREMIVEILRDAGYLVIEAADGADAMKACDVAARPVDLLVTDVVMPQMSGRELVERLHARHPTMKVLYVSGYAGDVLSRRGVPGTGLAFLEKPFDPDRLLRNVREVLDTATA